MSAQPPPSESDLDKNDIKIEIKIETIYIYKTLKLWVSSSFEDVLWSSQMLISLLLFNHVHVVNFNQIDNQIVFWHFYCDSFYQA